MNQKICIISFDHWNYDEHIVHMLQKMGVNSFHLKLSTFKHKSVLTRLSNTLSKIFFGINPKHIKRQEYLIERLAKKGVQDQILVINPEIIDLNFHLKIKKYTKKYICYLYDSVERHPVEHLLNGVFDEIFSFDKSDCAKYHFKEITNYNYLNEQSLKTNTPIKNELLYIASFDNRLPRALKIKKYLDQHNITNRFIIVGKKTLFYKFKNFFSSTIKGIELRNKRVNQDDLQTLYRETNVIIDLVQEHQTGLSFRIFEAMAFQKKIITNNAAISKYDFYNANNIFVLENEIIKKSFLTTKYQPIPKHIFEKYTLRNWISIVFKV